MSSKVSGLISASEYLSHLITARRSGDPFTSCIDVRSPGEFEKGALPGFINAPILNNQERHLVGTTYKGEGKEVAIELGHQLVAASKTERIRTWIDLSNVNGKGSPIVTCWRGGLRSKIACEWLRENGVEPRQLMGGFKGVRKILFSELYETEHPLLVLTGKTGSGKTKLLQKLSSNVKKIDLERIARHRGSAFGLAPGDSQPSQVTFENELALELMEYRFERLPETRVNRSSDSAGTETRIVIEDESRSIGIIRLPKNFKTALTESEMVYLEVSLEDRAREIFGEYVLEPREDVVYPHLRKQLSNIQGKLGDERYREVSALFETAILEDRHSASGESAHCAWIERLLDWYYDPMYEFAFQKWNRKTLFRGDEKACREFLEERYSIRSS